MGEPLTSSHPPTYRLQHLMLTTSIFFYLSSSPTHPPTHPPTYPPTQSIEEQNKILAAKRSNLLDTTKFVAALPDIHIPEIHEACDKVRNPPTHPPIHPNRERTRLLPPTHPPIYSCPPDIHIPEIHEACDKVPTQASIHLVISFSFSVKPPTCTVAYSPTTPTHPPTYRSFNACV